MSLLGNIGRKRRTRSALLSALAALAVLAPGAAAAPDEAADLILYNATVWTVDDAKPHAQAVAIEANRIVKVGSNAEVRRHRGPGTRMLDLKGQFVLPGFIDGHTHFENAADWFFEVRLVDVNEEAELIDQLKAATARVPQGMWITGYDWGAEAARRARRAKDHDFAAFTPSLAAVDAASPDHPLLLRRYDGAWFANSKALKLARIDRRTPDPGNGAYQRDPRTGELTGMLFGSAGPRLAETMPPKSRARTLAAARALIRDLNRYGITGIHDIARYEPISQAKIYHTHVERSASDMSIFTDLRERGELTVRVYPILTMASWADYQAHGVTPGSGDELIRFGALKAFVDGFYMERPYENNRGYAGGLTFRVVDEATMEANIVGADSRGFDAAVHVIGDKAHRLLLDWYEAAIARNPPRDRRFRLIHAWFPAEKELDRAARMGAVADITPYHLIREIDTLEARLGPDRARIAFPWRTMIQKGIRLNIVSDWPGSFDRGNIAPIDPLENIYYALSRSDLSGEPEGGWHAEQALTIDEAIRAYTINPAYASREENIKGSITEGKLADLVVLDRDIRKIPPKALLDARVVMTVFDGKVVYEAPKSSPARVGR